MDGTADGLDGSVALVAGASSGTGEATATAFADEGARGSVEVAGVEVAVEDALAVPTDVTDEGSVAALFEAVRSKYGGLDVLVNRVGGGPAASREQWLAGTTRG